MTTLNRNPVPSLLFRSLTFVMLVCAGLAGASVPLAAQEPTAPYPENWPSERATSVAMIPGGNELIVGSADGLLLRESSVLATSFDSPAMVRTLYKHPASVWAVVANDQWFASTDYRGNLMLQRRENGEIQNRELAFERWTRALAFAPDNQHLVAGNEAGKLYAWQIDKGESIKTLQLDAQQIFHLSFSPAGDSLAVADGAGHVHLVSWPALELVRKIKLGDQPVWGVQFTADGQSLLAGGSERKLWRVSVMEGSEPEVLHEAADWITGIQTSADRATNAITMMDGAVWVTDGMGNQWSEAGKLPSAAWASTIVGPNQIAVATRKHAIATLGQTWTVKFVQDPTASSDTNKPAAE